MSIQNDIAEIHAQGLRAAETFKRSAAELIDVLQWMDCHRGYIEFNCESVYQYARDKLKLAEDVSCNLIAIARKSNEVPALKESVRAGSVSVSNARKIVSVITRDNQQDWLKIASEKTARAVQQEVARVNPAVAVTESVKFVSANRLEMKVGISAELEAKLSRARDVLSQKRQSAATREQLLDAMVDCFLWHNDPVEKAKRSVARAEKQLSVTKRTREQNAEGSTNQDSNQNINRTPDRNNNIRASSHPSTNTSTSPSRSTSPRSNSNQQSSSVRRLTRRGAPRAAVHHQVNARDNGQCTERDPATGERCTNRRWIDLHHVIPREYGGKDEASNMTTLCSRLHRMRHAMPFL